jgi:hypothetical protein
MKIADEIMHGPSASQYRDADWNKICLDNEWDVRIKTIIGGLLSVRQLVAVAGSVSSTNLFFA